MPSIKYGVMNMKARMKDNLIVRYQQSEALKYKHSNELIESRKIHGFSDSFELKSFLKSIEGKVIDLVFTHGDAFEKADNNVWLPDDLWDEVI